MWEQRWHPLRQEWVIIAAHRNNRPWSGQTRNVAEPAGLVYDPACYLCPGNLRISGQRNPMYTGVFVFDNDHPCVGPLAPEPTAALPPIYRTSPARGIARVVCYTPRHNASLAELSLAEIDALLSCWQEQYTDLASREGIAHVLMFENKGEVVGVSNPHPHGQIYATNFVFKTIDNEAQITREHYQRTGRVMFEEIIAAEVSDGRRVLASNDSAIAFVPFFARYAYEVYVAPRACHAHIASLSSRERLDLAQVLQRVLVQYDNLWQMPFPYVMCLHQSPTDGRDTSGFHFHIEFHPPLRKPNLLKYLAGPEIGGGSFLSDTCPEEKAAELLATAATHYRHAALTTESSSNA